MAAMVQVEVEGEASTVEELRAEGSPAMAVEEEEGDLESVTAEQAVEETVRPHLQ